MLEVFLVSLIVISVSVAVLALAQRVRGAPLPVGCRPEGCAGAADGVCCGAVSGCVPSPADAAAQLPDSAGDHVR